VLNAIQKKLQEDIAWATEPNPNSAADATDRDLKGKGKAKGKDTGTTSSDWKSGRIMNGNGDLPHDVEDARAIVGMLKREVQMGVSVGYRKDKGKGKQKIEYEYDE
jgi:hypothetical protein